MMRIVNFSEEFNPEIEEELLKSVKFIIDTDRAFLGDFLQQRQYLAKNRMKTVLVASREKTAKENQSHIACEIIFVQYFAGGNYGFVKFISTAERFNELEELNHTRLQLVNEAISVVNKYAQWCGFDKCKEIFSVIKKKHNSKPTNKCAESGLCKSLYIAGFRWIEADLISSDFGSQCWTCLIVYRPNLVPNYQVENGIKWGYIATSVLLNFCEDIVTILNSSDYGKQTMRQVKALMNNFEESSSLDSNIVQPSFPWNGRVGPSPANQVVVVGGGLTGLSAAASLSKAGIPVVLLEASNYLGGRVKQVQPFEGFAPIDLGGEFIHGSNTVVNKIACDNGWVVLPASQCEAGEEGEKLFYKGKLYSTNSNQREIRLAREAWAELINSKYRNQEKETEYLSDSVKVRLEEKGLSRDVLDVIDWWKMKISAGSLDHYGVREGRRRMESKYEWGIEDCRLAESYSQLVKYYLANSMDVDKRLNWQVMEVVWKGDRVRSNNSGRILLKNQHGQEMTAKHVILTVPLTVLKDGDITFTPALPADKNKAIRTIQMLGAWKIACRFKRRFWPEKLHQIYSVRGFASEIWTCSHDCPDSDEKCHVVVGFETAEPAEEKRYLSGQEVLRGFLSHLDEIFGTSSDPNPASNSFMDFVYFHWSNHPYIRGGYTSPTAHAYELRRVLASPVDDRLFFAGEATSSRSCSTVPTAIETGTRAADEVCCAAGILPLAKL